MNRLRLEFTAEVFLADMRRHHARLHPEKDNPIGNLTDYSEAHRSALMAALEKAIKHSGGDTDALFNAWVQRREEAAHNQAFSD